MIFQKNVKFNLLVLKCVKVGDKCVNSEGLTPATSDVEKVTQSGCKPKFLGKYKGVCKSCWAVAGKVL